MSGSHGASLTGGLHVEGDGRLHHLPPQCKVAAAVLFVIAVVATPREALWAFGAHGVVVGVVVGLSGLRPTLVLRRLVFELPFVAFALFLPFLGRGERTTVLGVSLSVDGSWAAWNILAKGSLGVAASVVLAATTTMPDLIVGLERLRVPRSFTAIAGFMIRYLDVIVGQVQRMRIARLSRGDDPRWIWQARGWAASAGTLFIRSYERGERVHLAMLSRGFTGRLPDLSAGPAPRRQWFGALLAPAAAAMAVSVAWTTA